MGATSGCFHPGGVHNKGAVHILTGRLAASVAAPSPV